MIKEAIDRLLELSGPKTIKVGGYEYSETKLCMVIPNAPEIFKVNTLTGLVDFVQANLSTPNIIVHVVSEIQVTVESDEYDGFGRRHIYLTAGHNCIDIPFSRFMDVEEFIINLRSKFIKNGGMNGILRLVGNIKEDEVKTLTDDGITQRVTVASGVASVENVEAPSIVSLAPYRTFLEIEQPVSEFLLRMRKPGPQIALFEADGGAWRLEAITRIANYLRGKLGGDVSVIA